MRGCAATILAGILFTSTTGASDGAGTTSAVAEVVALIEAASGIDLSDEGLELVAVERFAVGPGARRVHVIWEHTTGELHVEPDIVQPDPLGPEVRTGCRVPASTPPPTAGWAQLGVGAGNTDFGCPRAVFDGPLLTQDLVCLETATGRQATCFIYADDLGPGTFIPSTTLLACAYETVNLAHVAYGFDAVDEEDPLATCFAMSNNRFAAPPQWGLYRALIGGTPGTTVVGLNNWT